ncbi:MAG: histidine--tRNA ligase [Methanobacteriota archaeon]
MDPLQRPRGTRDFSPEENDRRRWALARLEETVARFGYREVATPTFEDLELFTRKSGEGVRKQLYEFTDKGGRALTLRPELTAPTMRYYFSELAQRPKPLKLYYFGNCFRYEEPQSGRYREFFQFGVELLGADTPEANAEVVAVAVACLKALGLSGFKLRVGHIGILKGVIGRLIPDVSARTAVYGTIDKKMAGLATTLSTAGVRNQTAIFLEAFAGTTFAAVLQADNWKVRLQDDINGLVKALESDYGDAAMPAIDDVQRAYADLRKMIGSLKPYGLDEFEIDYGVVRGLDYYSGMVFEVHHPELGAESQICGGGAYTLHELFGAKPTGSIGFAIGFDRTLLALEREGHMPALAPSPLKAVVVPVTDDAREEAVRLATQLRRAGVACDVDLMQRNLRKCLDYANALGIPFAVLLGAKEMASGQATVKDLRSGLQETLERAMVAARILAG